MLVCSRAACPLQAGCVKLTAPRAPQGGWLGSRAHHDGEQEADAEATPGPDGSRGVKKEKEERERTGTGWGRQGAKERGRFMLVCSRAACPLQAGCVKPRRGPRRAGGVGAGRTTMESRRPTPRRHPDPMALAE